MASVERVGDIHCAVGESPVWWAAQDAWLWVDITARRIWRMHAASGAMRSWSTAEMVACLALARDGGVVAGMESGIFHLALGEADEPVATLLAAPPELAAGMRFNDGKCDRQGRFWSGTMCFDGRAEGGLYRYGGGTLSAPVVSNLVVQNGLGFSPDGRTMYLSDSHVSRQLVWAFDYDIASGTPSRQRLFVDMNAHPGRPDGAAVDVDGCYWICGNDAGQVLRFTPEGKLDRMLAVPMAKPSMCTFGGAAMDTLMVTSISAGAPEGDTWAGATVLLRAGVQGVAETPFAG